MLGNLKNICKTQFFTMGLFVNYQLSSLDASIADEIIIPIRNLGNLILNFDGYPPSSNPTLGSPGS